MRCVVPAVDSAAGHAPAARLVPILSLTPQHAAVGRSVARAGRGCIQHRPPTPKGVHLWFQKPDVCGGKRPAARTAATQPELGLHKQSPIFSEVGVLRSIPWWGVLGEDMGVGKGGSAGFFVTTNLFTISPCYNNTVHSSHPKSIRKLGIELNQEDVSLARLSPPRRMPPLFQAPNFKSTQPPIPVLSNMSCP